MPCAPAPLRGLRISGKPFSWANARTSAALSAAVDAAVGTPALRSASFIDGLSRHSHVVRNVVPGMPRASRTSAAAIWWDSIVDSRRSIHIWSCAHCTASSSWCTSVTLRTW